MKILFDRILLYKVLIICLIWTQAALNLEESVSSVESLHIKCWQSEQCTSDGAL